MSTRTIKKQSLEDIKRHGGFVLPEYKCKLFPKWLTEESVIENFNSKMVTPDGVREVIDLSKDIHSLADYIDRDDFDKFIFNVNKEVFFKYEGLYNTCEESVLRGALRGFTPEEQERRVRSFGTSTIRHLETYSLEEIINAIAIRLSTIKRNEYKSRNLIIMSDVSETMYDIKKRLSGVWS